MSENMENKMNALAGNVTADGSGDDWKSKYEALERKYQTEKVEAGRLRKAQDELDAAHRKIAELEGNERVKRVISDIDIPEEISDSLPDGFKETSARIAMQTVDQTMTDVNERLSRIEQTSKQEAQRAFVDKINREYPGFLDSIGNGGDKQTAWNSYLRYNSSSVEMAIANKDYDSLSYHIKSFFSNTLGLPIPSSGQDNSAVLDPSSAEGGHNGSVSLSPTKVYTYNEISSLYDKIESLRSKGDFAEIKKIDNEIQRAYAEGRVK